MPHDMISTHACDLDIVCPYNSVEHAYDYIIARLLKLSRRKAAMCRACNIYIPSGGIYIIWLNLYPESRDIYTYIHTYIHMPSLKRETQQHQLASTSRGTWWCALRRGRTWHRQHAQVLVPGGAGGDWKICVVIFTYRSCIPQDESSRGWRARIDAFQQPSVRPSNPPLRCQQVDHPLYLLVKPLALPMGLVNV